MDISVCRYFFDMVHSRLNLFFSLFEAYAFILSRLIKEKDKMEFQLTNPILPFSLLF